MSLASTIAAPVRKPRKRTSFGIAAKRNPGLVAELAGAADRHGIDPEMPRTMLALDHPEVSGLVNALEGDAGAAIRAILDRYPLDRLPTWPEWFYSFAPIRTHREGGKLYLVVAGWPHDGRMPESVPMTPNELVNYARLVVIDDPAA